MPTAAPPSSSLADRLLASARTRLFAYGYNALTMDDLARDAGISKKTLYLHFPGKEALAEKIIDGFASEVRAMAEAIFSDEKPSFVEKLHRFTQEMAQRFSRLSPHLLRDLERYAPRIYRHIEEVRYRNIPLVFGQLLRQGQAAGMVRPDIAPDFAIEFWRAAIQQVMHPATLERLQLAPNEAFLRAVSLFFGGLLTPAGHKAHEKHLAR